MSEPSSIEQKNLSASDVRLNAYYHDFILENFEEANKYYNEVMQLDPSAKNLQSVAQGASDRIDRAVTKAERGYRAVPGKKPAT